MEVCVLPLGEGLNVVCTSMIAIYEVFWHRNALNSAVLKSYSFLSPSTNMFLTLRVPLSCHFVSNECYSD
jgi:hypothetical protein